MRRSVAGQPCRQPARHAGMTEAAGEPLVVVGVVSAWIACSPSSLGVNQGYASQDCAECVDMGHGSVVPVAGRVSCGAPAWRHCLHTVECAREGMQRKAWSEICV
jgi:hypothetical protein